MKIDTPTLLNFLAKVKEKKKKEENNIRKRGICSGGVSMMIWKQWLKFKGHRTNSEIKSKKLARQNYSFN